MQDELEELAAMTGHEIEELYQAVRAEVMQEIAFQEMAVTVIMRDLIEIRRRSPRHADIIEYAVASPFCSYEELAHIGGVSKQAIYSTLDRMGNRYSWIMGLASIKAQVNRRGLPKHQQAGADVPAEPGNAP